MTAEELNLILKGLAELKDLSNSEIELVRELITKLIHEYS